MSVKCKITRANLMLQVETMESEKINTRILKKILAETTMEKVFSQLEEEELQRFEINGFIVFRFVSVI